jgi:hypothetical protein
MPRRRPMLAPAAKKGAAFAHAPSPWKEPSPPIGQRRHFAQMATNHKRRSMTAGVRPSLVIDLPARTGCSTLYSARFDLTPTATGCDDDASALAVCCADRSISRSSIKFSRRSVAAKKGGMDVLGSGRKWAYADLKPEWRSTACLPPLEKHARFQKRTRR